MHEADADLLDTSAPDDPAIWTALPYGHVSVPRVLSKDVHGVWVDAVVDALEYIQDAVKRAHEETIAAGVQHLLQLPEVLGNNRSGSGQKRRAAARVRDLSKRSRAAATLAAAAGFDAGQTRAPTLEDHALAGRIHRHVREGNDGRAAQCLDNSAIVPINDSTIEQLKALHPTATLPLPPDTGEAVRQHTLMLQRSWASCTACRRARPRGSAAGHMNTSGQSDCSMNGRGRRCAGSSTTTFQVLFHTRTCSTRARLLPWSSPMGGSDPSLSQSASCDL